MKKRAYLLTVPNILVLAVLGLELGLRCENLLAYLAYPVVCVLGLGMALVGCIHGLRAGRGGVPLALLCAATIAAYALVPVIWDWHRSLEFDLSGLAVIFFTSDRILGEFKGYMYVENDHPPNTEQFREL